MSSHSLTEGWSLAKGPMTVRIVLARQNRHAELAVDVEPFNEGRGFVVRPHPNAGGGAHPRHLVRNGFLSVSPAWNAETAFDVLKEGIDAVVEPRMTQAREKFLALLRPGAISEVKNILLLRDVHLDYDRLTDQVYFGTDRTSSGKIEVFECADLLPIGTNVKWDDRMYVVDQTGLTPTDLPLGVSPDDKLD